MKQSEQQAETLQRIDVRSATEFAAGHLPGAVNIPLEQLEGRLEDLDSSRTILPVCQSGTRAKLAATLLEPFRTDVAVLEGGTAEWVKQGRPVVASVRNRWSLERQVRLGAGFVVVTGVLVGIFLNSNWTILSGFAGLGLLFAGLTDICPLGILLGKMPWNRASHGSMPERAQSQ